MLSDATVVATVAVKDLAAGKKFYGETLGLKQVDENPGGVTYQCGDGKLFVYEAPSAGTGQATCASWKVSDFDGVVTDLKGKGISFENYDMPNMKDGIMTMDAMKAAWFKDPDGNVLCVANG